MVTYRSENMVLLLFSVLVLELQNALTFVMMNRICILP